MCQTSPDDVLELCITKINSLADIDCIHVFGDGRSLNLLKSDPRYINHAWNMVRINGCWYLTDVCWDCSHFKDGVRDDFYSTDYLFNKPVFFITSHFPLFKELQLLKPAINKDFSGYFIYPQQQQ